MCGIIGIIGKAPVTPLLVEALKRLEYRGYDSAGVATLVNGHIDRRRAEGKLVNLEARLGTAPLPGTIGIGHTRWATHGKPSERNAHPIATDRVAIVHNGIIENFQELKDELVAEGRRFDSDTDTEVVAQLLTSHLKRQLSPEEAMGKAMERLRGAFALVALFSGRHDILMCRRGSRRTGTNPRFGRRGFRRTKRASLRARCPCLAANAQAKKRTSRSIVALGSFAARTAAMCAA